MLRKILLTSVMMLAITNIKAQKDTIQYDWTKLINAVAQVESGGNPKVVNAAGCAGLLQITKICVRQCNIWLKQEGSTKRYTYNDRFDPEKSKEMFRLVQKYQNPHNDIEKAIRLWNGGPNYSKRGTEGYYRKVMRIYKKVGN